jgi:hypothetical protein
MNKKLIKDINEIIVDKDQSMVFIEMNDGTNIEVRAYWNTTNDEVTIVDTFALDSNREITEHQFSEEDLMEIIVNELKSNKENHVLIQND